MRKLVTHFNKVAIRLLPLSLIIVFIIGAVWPVPAMADLSGSGFETAGNGGVPVVVVGKVLAANKAVVLVPWILVGIAFVIVVVRLVQHIKKRLSVRPPRRDTLQH
jgi:hypothetical protein